MGTVPGKRQKALRGEVTSPKQCASKDETETSTQRGGRYYQKPERKSTSRHLQRLTYNGNNARKRSKAIKQASNGVDKKIPVQFEASMEVPSSRKKVGKRKDDKDKAVAR